VINCLGKSEKIPEKNRKEEGIKKPLSIESGII